MTLDNKKLSIGNRPPDLILPPQPKAMMVLMEEMPRSEPDLKRVTQAIQADPAIAGAMLKIVNSPAFGLTSKASSVSQAITFLGLRNINAIASAIALRQAMSTPIAGLERFWDTAEQVAMLCASLTKRIRGIAKDQAYTVGLFHDCGIPLLMQRFPTYKDTLMRANKGEGRSFDQTEQDELGTNHTSVGYFIAKSWHLPEEICLAILLHHSPDTFIPDQNIPDMTKNFVGLILLAEHIHHQRQRAAVDVEWVRLGPMVLEHFGLDEEDYHELIDFAQELVAA